MRKTLMIIGIALSIIACGESKTKQESVVSEKKNENYVEILYFHGKQRCATCVAIEENTKQLIEERFSEQISKGELVFKTIDINENETLADKYEITWSSLLVVDNENEKEIVEDLTNFAFTNALNSPEEFKEGVSKQINNMLNN
jgi:hypothetical protein